MTKRSSPSKGKASNKQVKKPPKTKPKGKTTRKPGGGGGAWGKSS